MRSEMIALIQKDWTAFTANKRLLLTLYIIPVVLTVFLPTIFILTFHFAPQELTELQPLLDKLPSAGENNSLEKMAAGLIFSHLLRYFFLLFLLWLPPSCLPAPSWEKRESNTGNPVILSFISETDFSGKSTGFFSGQYDRFFDFFSADDHRDRNRDVHFIGKLPATGYSLAPSYASAVPGHFPDRHYADCSFFR